MQVVPTNRPKSTRYLPVAVALALMLGVGAVHGMWTGRWGRSDAVERAVARLKEVPMTIGDWKGTERELPVEELRRFGIEGGLSRTYVNPDGERVLLTIVTGTPGPISVHTPEVCFPGNGYGVLQDRVPRSVELGPGSSPARLWDLRLGKRGPVAFEAISVNYAWSADGSWQAPDDDPRLSFASEPVLFKMYVVQTLPPDAAVTGSADAAADFVRDAAPKLRDALFPPPQAPNPPRDL